MIDVQMSFDRPLLMPKTEEQSMLAKQRETLIARMNMFIRLRQDLERVGNLHSLYIYSLDHI